MEGDPEHISGFIAELDAAIAKLAVCTAVAAAD
jgi:hypothetical protein